MEPKKNIKNYKVKINSQANIEALLEQTYEHAEEQLTIVLKEMNKLASSTELKDEDLDAKAKYVKSMHDLITDRDKAIGRKIEIAKLLTEIVKHNGDLKSTLTEKGIDKDIELNLDEFRQSCLEEDDSPENDTEIYRNARRVGNI